jgi:hypothetical protein
MSLQRTVKIEFKDYRQRTNLVNDENGDRLAGSHHILDKWKNFSQLLNVFMISDARQTEIQLSHSYLSQVLLRA